MSPSALLVAVPKVTLPSAARLRASEGLWQAAFRPPSNLGHARRLAFLMGNEQSDEHAPCRLTGKVRGEQLFALPPLGQKALCKRRFGVSAAAAGYCGELPRTRRLCRGLPKRTLVRARAERNGDDHWEHPERLGGGVYGPYD